MKLPAASKNVFPDSKENLEALLDYYFPKAGDEEKIQSLQLWLEKEQKQKFTLNQIEFGARLCRENEVLLDMCNFSSNPAARISNVLQCIFVPVNQWDKRIPSSRRKSMTQFRNMFIQQSGLLIKIDTRGFLNCVYPKSRENLSVILDVYFPGAGDAERKLSLIHFMDSREALSYIHYAAQFCTKNKSFLDQAGVSAIPSERIHEVITAIFRPSYTWLPGEFEENGERYKELKRLYFVNINSSKSDRFKLN